MSKSVVGLFKTAAAAQQVKDKLLGQGFSSENVRVIAQDNQSYAASAGTGAKSGAADGAQEGLGSTISHFFRSLTGADETHEQSYSQGVDRGGAMVTVTTADSQADDVADLLQSYGAEDVVDGNPTAEESYSSDTASNRGSIDAAPMGASASSSTGNLTVPIVEEDMQVGKRQVQRGGVRVYSHLESVPVEENIKLREERVRVDRRPVDRAATEQDFTGFKEGTIELNETGEEAVVSKQARVVEEVVIGKDVSERTEAIKDNLRHTEVETEQIGEVGSSRRRI